LESFSEEINTKIPSKAIEEDENHDTRRWILLHGHFGMSYAMMPIHDGVSCEWHNFWELAVQQATDKWNWRWWERWAEFSAHQHSRASTFLPKHYQDGSAPIGRQVGVD
jgi:hypothetical protein